MNESSNDAIVAALNRAMMSNTTPVPRQRQSAAAGQDELLCACGCNVSFRPRDERQRYLPGHRFKTYTMHRCPDCQVMHREGAKKDA